ncbi:MAG: GGDEF domain-containing protein [Gordonibacter sp.]|uniref:GGDEF domain-containing protein n=1 Tax=Gordonibacter sp. TaxID=1968902 RepID=UPI002FC5C041
MRAGKHGALWLALFSLAVCVAVGVAGYTLCRGVDDMRKRDASNVLTFFQQSMATSLQSEFGETAGLTTALLFSPNAEWFPLVAQDMLAVDGVVSVAYFEGDTLRYAFPEDEYRSLVGKDLTTFPYVYTLAKVTGEMAVEGPLEISPGKEAFLFIEPVVQEGISVGEVAIGLDADFVLSQLDFGALEEGGYRYELWAVSPQDGSKDVIAVSDEAFDFSHAVKISFGMPTTWTLSLIPVDGWVPLPWVAVIAGGCVVVAALAIGLGTVVRSRAGWRRRFVREVRIDRQTGMLSYDGFLEELQGMVDGKNAVGEATLVCLKVDGFEDAARLLGSAARRAYLEGVKEDIDSIVQGDHVALHAGCGSFAIAIREQVGQRDLEDLTRALELALLWKARVDGKKAFFRARSTSVLVPAGTDDVGVFVDQAISDLECSAPGGFR